MKRSTNFYIDVLLFLLMLTSFPYSLNGLPLDNSNLERNEENWEVQVECPTYYMTREELANSIREHKIAIKSNNVKKKVLNKKNLWNELITITGDVEKDYNNVISLLEISKDTNWSNWRLIKNPGCYPEIDPVVIRSDYVTEINGYKVRTSFTTEIKSKQAFLTNAWVVKKKD